MSIADLQQVLGRRGIACVSEILLIRESEVLLGPIPVGRGSLRTA